MFGPLNSEEAALIARLPRITRAREYHLYAQDGTRWLDCWADGGRALTGHRPKGVSLRLKNEIDRGLYAPYPSPWEGRLEKALLRLFTGYTGVRIFRNAERAVAALNLAEPPVDPLDLSADIRQTSSLPGALWGRPLLPGHPEADFLFPILPLPGLSEVQPVLFRGNGELLYGSDPASPLILAALSRSCAAITQKNRSEGGISPIPGWNADIWERRGPYMLFNGSERDYKGIFESLFAQNVLIAPSATRPSVMPAEISKKEFSILHAGIRGL